MSALLPNSTQIPDVILDIWLSLLSPSEVLVLLYLCRRTFGWRKSHDRVSMLQIMSGVVREDGTHVDFGTGLSERGARAAVTSLTQLGVLHVQQMRAKNGAPQPSVYSVNLAFTPVVHYDSGRRYLCRAPGPNCKTCREEVQVLQGGGAKLAPPPATGEVQNLHLQHTETPMVQQTTTSARQIVQKGGAGRVVVVDEETGRPGEEAASTAAGEAAEREEVAALLVGRGVSAGVATDLVATYGAVRCRKQEGWLSGRPAPARGTRAGQLAAAIRGDWAAPERQPGVHPETRGSGDVLENGAEQRRLFVPVIGRDERPPSAELRAREREELAQMKAGLFHEEVGR